jgi:Spy/CpxP family protein refolding chaperone
MKRIFLVLLAGLGAGVFAHLAWYRLNRPCQGDALNCQLAWMRAELKLTDEQFARLRSIHEASSPRLLALAAQVSQMRDEYAAFERERVTAGQVDFVEFAHYVEERRAIDRECLAATRQLVAAASKTLTPAQRERYLGLLGPTLETAAAQPQ